MKTYRVVSGFCLAPGVDVLPGAELDLDPRIAGHDVAIGRLELIDDAAPKDEAQAEKPAETKATPKR